MGSENRFTNYYNVALALRCSDTTVRSAVHDMLDSCELCYKAYQASGGRLGMAFALNDLNLSNDKKSLSGIIKKEELI